jgi:hypothetical protein
MKPKTANICANIYEGEFILSFDCVGVQTCRFALCSVMPPDGSEKCTYYDYGSCLCPHAKYVALETLRNRISKEMKQYEDKE